MSIPDELLDEWWRLAGGVSGDALETQIRRAQSEPYASKRDLARRIVANYHGSDAADAAEQHFDRLFREHAAPEDMPEVELALDDAALADRGGEAGVQVMRLLVAAGLAGSNSEAGRLIEQGAVAIDDAKVEDRQARIAPNAGDAIVIRKGKRHYARVRFQ